MVTETYNWNEYNARADDAFRPLPEGIYQATCTSAQPAKTSTGKDMIRTRYVVANGPEEGKSVLAQMVFSPENDTALGIFKRHLFAHGVDMATLTNQNFAALSQMILGAALQITVVHRDWQGETRMEITDYQRSGSAPPPPPPAKAGPPPPPPAPVIQTPAPAAPTAPPPPPPPVVESAPAPVADASEPLPPPPPPVLMS